MKYLDLSDPEGNQGWWMGHRKSQVTPDLFEETFWEAINGITIK